MITILPCYSLEDFSIYRTTAEADQIFSAWTVLYHPALIRHFDSMPSWDRAASPAIGKKHSLIVIPPCACGQIPRDWLRRAEENGSVIVKDQKTRPEMLRAAFEGLGISPGAATDDDADSFYALGFSYFVSELFSRKLRYMSNLDTQGFRENGLKAAKALGAGDRDEFEKRLRRAFELLTESKEYFFPTAMNLLDLTAADRKTLAALPGMLARRAARGEQTNLLLPTWHLDRFSEEFPEGAELLKSEIASGRVTLIGGDRNESPLWMFPAREIAERFLEGWEDYYEKLGTVPAVFGRNQAGYTPILPFVLQAAGCPRALLFTRDGWKGCDEPQSRVDWRGGAGGMVGTLSRPTFDASDAKTFMRLSDRIGYSSSGDRALSAVFEHRPGQEAVWLSDIARMSKFAPVLGEVLSLGEFFKKTDGGTIQRKLSKDTFRTNYLTRAVQAGRRCPVSVWPRLRRLSAEMDLLAAIALFAGLEHPARSIAGLPGFETLAESASPLDELKAALIDQVSCPIAPALEGFEEADAAEREAVEKEIRAAETERLSRIETLWNEGAETLWNGLEEKFAPLLAGTREEGNGMFLLNMTPRPALYRTETRFVSDPAAAPFVRTRMTQKGAFVTVTVPAFSLLALRKETAPPPEPAAVAPVKKSLLARALAKVKGEDPAADPDKMVEFEKVRFKDGATERFYTVRTGYYTMKIDADTGAVTSVRTHSASQISGRRGILNQPGMGNRIAWQIAMKLGEKALADDHRGEGAGGYGYSLMAAEKIDVLSDGPAEAALRITGSLIAPGGQRLARYEQTITAIRSSRVIDVDLAIHPAAVPEGAPWDEYYGVRFAWNDTLAELRPACHGVFWEMTRDFFPAPDALDIRSEEKLGVTILSAGLPFYRRYDTRRADMVLIPRGEDARRFHFGIGIDLADPLAEAAAFDAPGPVVLDNAAVNKSQLTRFLEVSPAAVAVEELKPVYETPSEDGEASPESEPPRLTGFRILLHETAGKKAQARVRTRLPIAAAAECDLFDRPQTDSCQLEDGHTFSLRLNPGELRFVRIDIDFNAK